MNKKTIFLGIVIVIVLLAVIATQFFYPGMFGIGKTFRAEGSEFFWSASLKKSISWVAIDKLTDDEVVKLFNSAWEEIKNTPKENVEYRRVVLKIANGSLIIIIDRKITEGLNISPDEYMSYIRTLVADRGEDELIRVINMKALGRDFDDKNSYQLLKEISQNKDKKETERAQSAAITVFTRSGAGGKEEFLTNLLKDPANKDFIGTIILGLREVKTETALALIVDFAESPEGKEFTEKRNINLIEYREMIINTIGAGGQIAKEINAQRKKEPTIDITREQKEINLLLALRAIKYIQATVEDSYKGLLQEALTRMNNSTDQQVVRECLKRLIGSNLSKNDSINILDIARKQALNIEQYTEEFTYIDRMSKSVKIEPNRVESQ